ncbi:MAG: MgtC/SapB family protein [Gammaproteobacteria bacterium]|nr:MgtC/SapB family protein [Gammaproteobacteria bacterium]
MIDHDLTVTFVRLVAAIFIGGIIGLERSINGRPAGFRTHALVCLSSSVLMLLTVYQWKLLADAPIDTIRVDPTRMAQGIMTGIGFLGAGVIMKERFTIRGLTTAASIWVTASIGILVGMGFFSAAGIATVLALGTLSLFRIFEQYLPTVQFGRLSIRTLRKSSLSEDDLLEIVSTYKFTAGSISYNLESEGKYSKMEMIVRTRHPENFRKLSETLNQMEEIQEFSLTPRSS